MNVGSRVRNELHELTRPRAPHRVILAYVILLATAVVSIAWISGPTWLHDGVHDVAFYTGAQLTEVTAWRMGPGAFLVIGYKELLPGLFGLAIALIGLERKAGWWRTLLIIVCAHFGATILAGLFLRLQDQIEQLGVADIGSSVVMFSAAAALALSARSRLVAFVIVCGLAIDLIVNHDLATSEHIIGVVIGLTVAVALRLHRRQGL